MKAMCPHCGGTGEIDVEFAKGVIFTRKCLNTDCQFENGGRIMKDGNKPEEPSEPCVICGSDTYWMDTGETT